MCGIFGLVRNTQASNPERATAAFVELGRLAVERGKDAAGFALVNPSAEPGVPSTPTRRQVEARCTSIDQVLIYKDVVSFHDLWDDSMHLHPLSRHRVALGHTRWATQGKRDALTNASPLAVGSLVGTHNGDVDTRSVNNRWNLPKSMGSTDTEVLYNALNRDRHDRRKVTETLRTVEGRAALAWVDRGRTQRVYLARAALSPLSIAFDAEGNLYWASNPRWFRDIDAQFGGALGFHTITLVEEGALLTVSLTEAAPFVEDQRRFTPMCRPSDARLSDGVVWRGFDRLDREADKAQTRHKVAPSRYSAWSKPAASTKRTEPRKTGGGWGGWDMSQPGFVPAKSAAESASVLRDIADSASALRSIPNYDDTLVGIDRTVFTDWNTEADGDQSLWGDENELLLNDEEEAMRAANQWVDDGADMTVLNVLRSASMPSEIENLLSEFDLSSVRAFEQFREIVSGWSAQATAR